MNFLHGRTNLLEGSRLRGSFDWNSTETRVKPDGSFDMKIEYKYREDTPFIIEFRPNDYQWNIIEETYGEKGQKLVGDLVKTNSSGTVQYIEKEFHHKSTELHVPDNVELIIEGTEVKMLVPDHVLFDFDQFALKEESKAILSEIGKTLGQFDKNMEVLIHGHSDNVGDSQYNLDLSKKRAEEVKNFLLKQSNLGNISFLTEGFGETKPIASNDDEAGQAKNRRVEIVINLR